MKILNVPTEEAIQMCVDAHEYVNSKFDKVKADLEVVKEDWIQARQKTAWFGSSRERWETKWSAEDEYRRSPKHGAEMDLGFGWFEKRLGSISGLRRRLRSLEEQGKKAVMLEEKELVWLHIDITDREW